MHKLYTLLIAALATAAMAVTLSGTVVDPSGAPIQGARLMLVDTGLIAYSGADGSFAFSEEVSTVSTIAPKHLFSVGFTSGRIALQGLTVPEVSIALYSVSGRQLYSAKHLPVANGALSFSVAGRGLASQLLLFQLTAGDHAMTTKLIEGQQMRPIYSRPAQPQPTRSRAGGEVLVVDRTNFTAVRQGVSDYNESGVVVVLAASDDKRPAGMVAIPGGVL